MQDFFPNNVKKLRSDKKLTQQEFADKIGVTAATVSAYEKGDKSPSITSAVEIAKQFDVSLDWLCMGIEEKAKSTDSLEDAVYFLRTFIDLSYFGTLEANRAIIDGSDYGPITKDEVVLTFQGEDLRKALEGWSKISGLVKDGTITEDMAETWVNGLLSQYKGYDIEIDQLGNISFNDLPF